MFGFLSLFAVIFTYFFVDETMGLSEKQKKALYIPGAKFGRKLRPDEKSEDFPTTPFAERKKNVKVNMSNDGSFVSR